MADLASEPWRQRDDETAQAYAAFVAYRDMGPGRSVDAVARERSGHQSGTSRAPGRLKSWSVQHEWTTRAGAWDRKLATAYQFAAERAVETRAEDWVVRRDQLFEAEFRTGARLLKIAETIAKFPLTREVASDDGKAITIEPVGLDDLRRAASIAREASELCRSAVQGAMDVASRSGRVSVGEADSAKAKAEKDLEQWRTEQRAKIFAMPNSPPVA